MSAVKHLLGYQRSTILSRLNPLAWSHPSTVQVRHRKPRWLRPQRAKSKEGIYFHHPWPCKTDWDRGEMMYKSYNSLLRSIGAMFQEEILLEEEKREHKAASQNEWNEEGYHRRCMEYNDLENERMRKRRTDRLGKILDEQRLREESQLLEEDQEIQEWVKKFETQVQVCLKDSQNWVNMENLEEKINEALDNVVNFNFAVHPSGLVAKRTMQP